MSEALMNMSDYDENQAGGGGGGVVVPEGRYKIYIAKHEITSSATKQGVLLLKLTYLIAEGDHADKQVSEYFTIRHPASAEAVRISGEKVKSLTIACKLDGNQILTEDLIRNWYGKMIVAEFYTEKAKANSDYGDATKSRRFYAPDSPALAAGPTAPAPGAVAPPPATAPATAPPATTPPPASAPPPAAAPVAAPASAPPAAAPAAPSAPSAAAPPAPAAPVAQAMNGAAPTPGVEPWNAGTAPPPPPA